MALSFPTHPRAGDTAIVNNKRWRWDGGAWGPAPRADQFVEAPMDGQIWGRKDGTWEPALGIDGGALSGELFLPGNPTQPMEIATKQYVDNLRDGRWNWFIGALGNYVTFAHLHAYYWTAGDVEGTMNYYYSVAVGYANSVAASIQGANSFRLVWYGADPAVQGRLLQFHIAGNWYTAGFQ